MKLARTIAGQANGLIYPDFESWFHGLPLAKQYQYQREAGFPLMASNAAQLQRERAQQLGLKPDAAPALILYLHHRGRAWIGKPSLRLEFATNEAALQTAARFADQGVNVRTGGRGAEARDFDKKLQEMATQSKADAYQQQALTKAQPVATTRPTKAAPAVDSEYLAVRKQLANGEPITGAQATRYPDLVRQFSEFFDSLGLTMVSDAATSPAPAAALPADGSVVLVPVADIKTDKALFQNREADYSEESVNRILAAVAAGSFRWEVLDPVILWRKPGTADVYSLSGHSRKEAFKRLAAQGARVNGRGFEAIPAKITECSQAEAVKIALNSNSLATKETELERGAYYRNLRANGTPRREIESYAAGMEGKNKNFILNLSFLAPTGAAIQALASFADAGDGSGKEVVRTLADWTGEARRRFPQLSDRHENEAFDWLRTSYGTKPGQLRAKSEFLQRLETVISRATTFGQFDADQPLNLANRTGKGSVEIEYDARLDEARRTHQDAEKNLSNKRRELVARNATAADLARILPAYENAVTHALQQLNKVSAQKFDVKDAAKNQASLFGPGPRPYRWPGPAADVYTISGTANSYTIKPELLDEMNVPEIKVSYKLRRFDKRPLNSSADVADLFREVWDKPLLDVQECFYALFMTGSGSLLGYYKHTVGGTASVEIDKRLLLGAALKCLAGTIFVAHNHPSGVLTPSQPDIDFTRSLKAACRLLSITVLDSMIITRTAYTSLSDSGLM